MPDLGAGICYIVPTPIGNLEDITFRAIKVLQEVDFIYAEDTRTSAKLLKHYQVTTPLRSFHAFNEHSILNKIISDIESGCKIALISDAGTPAISDPGFLLTRELAAKNLPFTCLPGATAFVPALVLSGFSTDQFYFEGFLPHKKGRETRLKQLASKECTIVLYESPYRLQKLLNELLIFVGSEREVAVVREISKVYEQCVRGEIQMLLAAMDKGLLPSRGEIVVVVSGKPKEKKKKCFFCQYLE